MIGLIRPNDSVCALVPYRKRNKLLLYFAFLLRKGSASVSEELKNRRVLLFFFFLLFAFGGTIGACYSSIHAAKISLAFFFASVRTSILFTFLSCFTALGVILIPCTVLTISFLFGLALEPVGFSMVSGISSQVVFLLSLFGFLLLSVEAFAVSCKAFTSFHSAFFSKSFLFTILLTLSDILFHILVKKFISF